MGDSNITNQSTSVLASEYTQPGTLRLEFVSRSFDISDRTVDALKGVNLTIAAGEFVAIMGYSGSGKTTTLNILGLLDRPTAGSYFVGDVRTNDLSQNERARMRKDKFGFIFQNFNLLDRYTVLQNIELAMVYQRVSGAASRRLALDLLNQLGLSGKAQARPHQLSGGQAQRVAIARALINNPPIILADEPTGNLDETAAREVVGLLKTLSNRGTTVVMVTHSPEVAQYASRTIVMKSGSVISAGESRV